MYQLLNIMNDAPKFVEKTDVPENNYVYVFDCACLHIR